MAQGSIDSYTYNARSELTSARRTKNGQPVPGFSEDFDYDPIGNRRSSATYNEKGEAQTSTYEANNLNQYTSRTTPGYAAVRGEADPDATMTVNENPTFRLGEYYFGSDTFDNSTSGGLANLETYAVLREEKVGGGGEEENDLVSVITNQVYLAQSPETFAYDDDGNQTLITTKTGLWRVTYNGENRPIRWELVSPNSNTPNSNTQTPLLMSYDHMGRRREKNAQRFFYDGYLQVADNGGNEYAWDCSEPVATRPLTWFNSALDTSHSALYYAHDGNKNVSEVIAADCSLTAHYDYAPFGSVIAQRGTFAATNPWRFSSEYAEDDTATVYYNYRHYEPVAGRWLQRDPIRMCVSARSFLRSSVDMARFDLLWKTMYTITQNNTVSGYDRLGLYWTFSPVTWNEGNASLAYEVSYTIDEKDRLCCQRVKVDRYVRKFIFGGDTIGLFVLDHTAGEFGGSFEKDDVPFTAFAEDDSPAGPGHDDLFRIRWTQRFKWVAICTEGEWKDKKLSEVTKDFTTSFRWKDGVYHGWFKEPGSALPVILPPIIKLL
jgi:RHS repeat-associated protein